MPPRWPRKPDRRDPDYRRLDDRMNFALHVAIFAASNSSLWFFRNLQPAPWIWTAWVTGTWALLLLAHGIYIFAVADYSNPASESPDPEDSPTPSPPR
ncbi:2TM domain-containing protein [Kamptonema formosum]|uniref:2TM domain-containing protein n=1 Tax=Kamptonema formosum TaxID=331992 RepID=UPI000347691A|nr:2TM domain-containing protein [Oscillatoria sp. PCC 10802]